MAEAREPRDTGLCIVRVWHREGGLVIRVRSRTDVESPATDRESTVADAEAAVWLVRAFLAEMAARAAEGGVSPPP